MRLRPIRSDELDLVAGWLQDERNSPWLDFGSGRRSLDTVGLKVMCQRDLHCLRLYVPDGGDRPVGIVGLSNVDREFGTAEVWFVRGEKELGPRGVTVQGVDLLLEHGFGTMGLQAVFAWTVEINRGGRRVLERLGFTQIGRRRRCHAIDGRLYDRLLFDLLAEEYAGSDGTRGRSGSRRSVAAPIGKQWRNR